MIRIGYVINSLPIGGAEVLLLNFIQRLDKNEYHVFIYTLFENNPLKSDFEKAGAHVREMRLKSFRHFWGIAKLSKLMREDRLMLVHTHLCNADLYGRIAARIAGVKTIISTEHSLHPWKSSSALRYKVRTFFDLLTVKFCKAIICVSEAVCEYHVRWGIPQSKMCVIYPSKPFVASALSKDTVRKELNLSLDDFVVITVGRLFPMKNHMRLIRAACAVLDKQKDFKFILVGDGPLRDELVQHVRQSNHSEKILFLGTRLDIPEILSISDIFVLPSLYEGFPLTIIEAMQCGLPVIASNVGGIPEIVDDKTGILINPLDVDELANAMLWLYENQNIRTRMKHMAMKKVNEVFSFDNHVHKILSLYEEVLTTQ